MVISEVEIELFSDDNPERKVGRSIECFLTQKSR